MATERLTFEQGVIIGIIAATKAMGNMDATLPGADNVQDAYRQGEDFFQRLVKEYTGKVVPGYPEGIPREALLATDDLVRQLVMANEI